MSLGTAFPTSSHVCPPKTCWSESRCLPEDALDLCYPLVPCEDSGHTMRMCGLIGFFAGRTSSIVENAVPLLIYNNHYQEEKKKFYKHHVNRTWSSETKSACLLLLFLCLVIYWLIDWLTDWLIDWLIDWMVGWLPGCGGLSLFCFVLILCLFVVVCFFFVLL